MDRVPPGLPGGPPWKIEDADGLGVPPKFQKGFTKKMDFFLKKIQFLKTKIKIFAPFGRIFSTFRG